MANSTGCTAFTYQMAPLRQNSQMQRLEKTSEELGHKGSGSFNSTQAGKLRNAQTGSR